MQFWCRKSYMCNFACGKDDIENQWENTRSVWKNL